MSEEHKFKLDGQDWVNVLVQLENIEYRLEKIEEMLDISEWFLPKDE